MTTITVDVTAEDISEAQRQVRASVAAPGISCLSTFCPVALALNRSAPSLAPWSVSETVLCGQHGGQLIPLVTPSAVDNFIIIFDRHTGELSKPLQFQLSIP